MDRNYQLELDLALSARGKNKETPTLLLHSCCAPCSSYVLEYLSRYFKITVFYYNPNISPKEEYEKRVMEQKKFILEFGTKNEVKFMPGKYDFDRFDEISKGLENEAEGGERCNRCYELRLTEAAAMAAQGGFDYFCTTLSVSPYKNASKLNELGGKLANEYKIAYLYSDFKKKNGYKRSCLLSIEYGLYRQDYCGCIYSKRDADLRNNNAR